MFSRSRFKRKPLSLVLSKDALWLYNQEKLLDSQEKVAPLTLDHVLSACRQWEETNFILFLEYPWVMSQFEIVLPLASHEVISYTKNRFSFHLTASTEASHVGAAFLEQQGSAKKGLFYAILSPQAMALLQALKTQLRCTVEAVPLMYSCLCLLRQQPTSELIFHGINQAVFIEKKETSILKWIPLPSLNPVAGKNLIADHYTLKSSNIDIVRLSCNDIESETEKILPILQVIRSWKGFGKNAHKGFWWESPQAVQKREWRKIWIAGFAILVIGIWWAYQHTLNNTDTLSTQLKDAEKQIEASQNEITRLKEYTRKQNHFLRTNTLYQHLKSSSIIARNVLEQVIAPIQGVWVKSLKYEEEGLELSLLTLEPQLVSQVLSYLNQATIIQSVRLRYQQNLKLNAQNIIEFALSIQLKPQLDSETTMEKIN